MKSYRVTFQRLQFGSIEVQAESAQAATKDLVDQLNHPEDYDPPNIEWSDESPAAPQLVAAEHLPDYGDWAGGTATIAGDWGGYPYSLLDTEPDPEIATT